jgi:hypothetical protein
VVEPVIFPNRIGAVQRADRVVRARPRRDSKDDSRFARHLREEAQDDSSPPSPEEDKKEPGTANAAATAEELPPVSGPESAGEPEAPKKLIDIRV